MSLEERPRGSTRPTPKVHYNSFPRTSIEGALGVAASALLLPSIHPSAWKWNSPKFACRILHSTAPKGSESAYGPTPKR